MLILLALFSCNNGFTIKVILTGNVIDCYQKIKMLPILRASMTSGTLYTIGDVINQTYFQHEAFDPAQTLRFGNSKVHYK